MQAIYLFLWHLLSMLIHLVLSTELRPFYHQIFIQFASLGIFPQCHISQILLRACYVPGKMPDAQLNMAFQPNDVILYHLQRTASREQAASQGRGGGRRWSWTQTWASLARRLRPPSRTLHPALPVSCASESAARGSLQVGSTLSRWAKRLTWETILFIYLKENCYV